jgi:hypothetical protein
MLKLSNRVILLGNSIFMAGIAASLAAIADLEVCLVPQCCTECERVLFSQPMPFVLYDMSMDYPTCITCITRRNPTVILIGLDPNSEFARGPDGKLATVLSAHDLADIIRSKQVPAVSLQSRLLVGRCPGQTNLASGDLNHEW